MRATEQILRISNLTKSFTLHAVDGRVVEAIRGIDLDLDSASLRRPHLEARPARVRRRAEAGHGAGRRKSAPSGGRVRLRLW